MNNNILKKYESKYKFLTKVLNQFSDINDAHDLEIEHFFSLYSEYKFEISKYHLNYVQYKNFQSLYKIIKKITLEEDLCIPKDLDEFEVVDGWYIIKSETYTTTVMYGSSKWCISKSLNTWKKYNDYKNHYILINKHDQSKKFGLSFNDKEIIVFDEKNEEVNHNTLISKYPNLAQKLKIQEINNKSVLFEYLNLLPTILCLTLYSIQPGENLQLYISGLGMISGMLSIGCRIEAKKNILSFGFIFCSLLIYTSILFIITNEITIKTFPSFITGFVFIYTILNIARCIIIFIKRL